MSEASQPDATTTASNRKAETDRERSRDDPAVESAAAPSVSAGGTESAVVVSGGGDGRSFQQLLAGAIAAPAVSPRTAPIIAAVPVVAVPCFIAPAGLIESSGFTGHFAMTHQAVLATVTAQAQMQLQGAYPSSSSELATSSLAQHMLTAIGPVPLQQKPVGALEENVCTPEVDQPPPSELKSQSPRVIIKAASSDGYNWRKYGQKQVKSSDRSRSYYKCTNADCSAKKKVEHRQDGHVTEIIYRGIHNHDPPLKQRYSKEKGSQSGGPSEENENIEVPSEELNEADQTTSKTEQITAKETPEQQLHCSSDCEEDAAVRNEDDVVDEPEPKRRLTECNVPCTTPILRTVKEPKIVVQAASDAGIVSDGYRWRKYGQKIVKGNPNPRSYYRCTHNGCPVRKHVERALEDAKAMVITYEGKHNHDLPTPKNCNDPSAAALLISAAAAATATTTEQLQSPDSSTDQKPSAKSLEDTDGGNTGEKLVALEGKNTMESAQTLLSIGSNSSPAGEMSNGTNSSSIQRPIFSDNHAVQVQNS